MLRIRNVQVDLPPAAFDDGAAWWAAALGGTPRETDGVYVHLDGVRAPVGVHLQRLGDGPAALHLDLEADDVAAEVARLLDLGAEDLGPVPGEEHGERILRDPAGLVCCVAPVGQAQQLSAERSPSDLRLLVLDVPADAHAASHAFWGAALGGESGVGERQPEYAWVGGLQGPGGGEVGLLVQRLEDGPARVHVDLHVADRAARDAEVARLVGLGATHVAAARSWVTLATPGGPLVCVVPDDE